MRGGVITTSIPNLVSASASFLPKVYVFVPVTCAYCGYTVFFHSGVLDVRDAECVVSCGIAFAGVGQEDGCPVDVAAEHRDLGKARKRVRNPALALCRVEQVSVYPYRIGVVLEASEVPHIECPVGFLSEFASNAQVGGWPPVRLWPVQTSGSR